jgi:hypothetical protein
MVGWFTLWQNFSGLESERVSLRLEHQTAKATIFSALLKFCDTVNESLKVHSDSTYNRQMKYGGQAEIADFDVMIQCLRPIQVFAAASSIRKNSGG